MNLLKFATAVNWIVIAILAFLVIAETLFPAKGGDAAGRGIGQAIYFLAIILLLVLLVLNLLPYKWARYTGLGIVIVPMAFIYLNPKLNKLKRTVRNMVEESKPLFEDKDRNQIAKAIRNGEVEKLKQILPKTPLKLSMEGELLAYAISEASSSSYRPKEKLECVRLLFEAGARWASTLEQYSVPPHFAVAEAGNAALLRLLLEKGANANATQVHFKRPILFEALGGYQEPEETVRVLLEYGANPNATALFDHETGLVPPLWVAALMERWSLCVILLEHGADPNFTSVQGKTLRALIAESERGFPQTGYSTQADYDRLKQRLKQ